jgi:MOSC domain
MKATHLYNKPAERAKMTQVDHLELDLGGVVGSSDNNVLSPRQVLLASADYADELDIRPGDFRENVLVSGLVVEDLPSGTILSIGSATLSITFLCEPCGYMDYVRKGLKKESVGRRGVLAVVLESGEITTGDEIKIIKIGQHDWNTTYQKLLHVLTQINPELLVKGSDLLVACQLETSYFRVLPVQLRKIYSEHPEVRPERVVSEKGVSYMSKGVVGGEFWVPDRNMFSVGEQI